MAVVFRNKNLAYARKEIDSMQQDFESGSPLYFKRILRQVTVGQGCFLDAKKILTYLKKNEDSMVRVEGVCLSIFSNNRSWICDLKSNISSQRILEFWEPDPKTLNLLSPKTIIVNTPTDYKYKVTLGPKGCPSFAKWAEQNPQHIKIGNGAKKELAEDGWVNGYYFYARDDKSLQICSLMLGSNIRRIDTLICKLDIDK